MNFNGTITHWSIMLHLMISLSPALQTCQLTFNGDSVMQNSSLVESSVISLGLLKAQMTSSSSANEKWSCIL